MEECRMQGRLKELRRSRRMSQNVLGCEMGMSQQNISRYEKSVSAIPIDMLLKFADYYKVTTDYILGISNVKRTEESFAAESEILEKYGDFLSTYESLNDADRELVWGMMSKIREIRGLQN